MSALWPAQGDGLTFRSYTARWDGVGAVNILNQGQHGEIRPGAPTGRDKA